MTLTHCETLCKHTERGRKGKFLQVTRESPGLRTPPKTGGTPIPPPRGEEARIPSLKQEIKNRQGLHGGTARAALTNGALAAAILRPPGGSAHAHPGRSGAAGSRRPHGGRWRPGSRGQPGGERPLRAVPLRGGLPGKRRRGLCWLRGGEALPAPRLWGPLPGRCSWWWWWQEGACP